MLTDFLVREKAIALDADTLAALDAGIRSENEGPDYSWEDVKAMLKQDRDQWAQETVS